ncbi:MAG: M20/M25/M40 family metallo-hydrolase, partial [Phycisphaerales bacterium]
YSEEKGNNKGRNVLAKIKGTDPELKDQYIVMGGHLDHLGMRGGYVYSGADDNASGTAVVMEVARVLAEADFKPKRTIIFACWTGEELGLLGSKHYVSKPCDGVSIDRVVASFNMDMVGLGDTLRALGALNFPSIWEVIKRDQDEDVMSVIDPQTGGPGGSDHSAFITKGIETVYLMSRGGVGHPDYHRPEDDAAKMDPEILRKTGQFVLQGTINLANETKVNLIIEDRQALYDGMQLYVMNINPELEDSDWSIVHIDANDQEKLRWRVASVDEKPRKTLDRGINDLRVFAGDAKLLVAASEALGFGRIDIHGNDGAWIDKGRLTRQGRYDFGLLDEERITVNLISPSLPLLRAMLIRATRPFIVTGYYRLNKRLCELIDEKKVLLGVKFNPRDVDGCVKRLEEAKGALGDSDNLVLYITSTEGLDEAKK